jgi:4-hydroxy-tetrahydrodipicolinate synthase
MLPIINSLFAEGSPSGVKAYLAAMGIVEESFRLPVVGVGDALKNTIQNLMKSI